MMVRPGKELPSHKSRNGEPTPKPKAANYTFPAPMRGWIINEGLAIPQPGGAAILDNWVCTTIGIRPREGSAHYARLGSKVQSMFTYTSNTEHFFAATTTEVFDITSVPDPEVFLTSTISGQTSGYYSSAQFGTPGGDYMYIVNGTDKAQLFDGASWTQIDAVSTPAITGIGTDALSHVWSYGSRLFFVEGGTKSAWYLPVDSIGGAATEFSLAGIFKKGGSLLFGATWSLDAGDGLDDKCVFVSTEGEVAIYEGTNPGSAADWRIAGLYNISKPLGQNATMQAGGDLLIATESGLVPLSAAIQRDRAALEMAAVSAPITPYWQSQVSKLGTEAWEVMKWPQKNILIVSQPGPTTDEGSCLVANLQTGAWSRFTGWVTRCLGFYDGYGHFAGENGRVYRMGVSGSDSGTNYTASYLGLAEHMTSPGAQKTVLQMRAQFQSSTPIYPLVSVNVDFDQTLSNPPGSALDYTDDLWDVGEWDIAVWDSSAPSQVVAKWVSVGRTGYAIAPEIQLTFGTDLAPDVELVSIDTQYALGAIVT